MGTVVAAAGPVRIPQGRERRRKGLVNALRRCAYGLMIWLGQHQALAAERVELKSVQPLGRGALALTAPAPATRFGGWLLRQDDPAVIPLLRVKAAGSWREVRRLKDGFGLDLGVQDYGSLHLALHPKRDQMQPGTRLSLGDSDPDKPAVQPLWSLGGAVDLVQYSEAGRPMERERRVHCATQLLLDADRLTGLPGDGVVTVQHAYWQGSRYIPDQPVWQLRMRWRF